jgi:hypothetical protein
MAAFVWNIPAASDQVIGSNNADDMLAAINAVFVANSGGVDASWEVATYQSTSPRYVILRRKSGGAGRIVIFGQQGSTPNAAAVQGTATASVLYIGFSATSTSDTIDTSYLSGAPLSAGDYIPGLRCCTQATATWRVNYAEWADGVYILFSNTSSGIGVFGAGNLIDDLTGAAVEAVQGSGSNGSTAWATSVSNSGSIFPASVVSSTSYSSADAGLIVRVSGANNIAFRAQSLATAVAQKLNNASSTKCWFLPIYVVFNSTDATLNFVGKIRQVGFGPNCDRETTRTDGGGVVAYGHQNTTASANQPGVWFVDAEL